MVAMQRFNRYMFAVFVVVLSLVNGFNDTNSTCELILQGSTVINKYQDYYLNFTGLNITNKEITFDSCSSLSGFDIILNLYNKNKDNIIAFCGDECNGTTCMFGNTPFPSLPIWTLNLNDLNSLEYILNINGKFNSFGNYYIKVIYPCTFDIYKNSFIYRIQNNITTTSTEVVKLPESQKPTNIKLAHIIFWPLCASICIIWITTNFIMFTRGYLDGDKDAVWGKVNKIFFQVFVACASILSALALSNAFGLDAKTNGTIAVMMGSLTLILSFCKYLFAFVDSEDNNDDDVNVKALVFTIFYATYVDSAFDIIQGIAAIEGKEYSELSVTILVFATWLGVSEEIIEGIITIMGSFIEACDGCSQLKDLKWCLKIIYWFISLGGVTECCLGIYLLSTFNGTIFIVIGIIIQSLLLLCGIFVLRIVYVVSQKDSVVESDVQKP